MTAFDRGGSSFSSLVRVFSSASIPEGLLAKGRLEAEGIPVFMKGESEGPYRIGPVHLWVPDNVEVQARVVLAEASANVAGDLPEDEPSEPEDYRFEY